MCTYELSVDYPHFACVSACLFFFGAAQALAAPLFDDNTVLEVTLSGPIGTLLEDKEARKELPFTLAADGVEQQIKVRLRGHSRLRVCDFPPLRLNFSPSGTAQAVFVGQDKLKLVTHCRNYQRGEQDMLEEYAAYRIFNVLTDASYRVRLLRMEYDDTDERLDANSRNRYGFLLEPGEQFAGRTGATMASLPGVPKGRHDLEHSALVYVFQYLIANTDWGFVKADNVDACCHNGDLYEFESQVLFVPYDFDLSGLVNAQYAFPDRSLRIDRVTQRLYRGLCTDREILQAALAKVRARKAEILAVLQNTPGLSKENVDKGNKFVNAFFEKAENEEKLLRSFERRCI